MAWAPKSDGPGSPPPMTSGIPNSMPPQVGVGGIGLDMPQSPLNLESPQLPVSQPEIPLSAPPQGPSLADRAGALAPSMQVGRARISTDGRRVNVVIKTAPKRYPDGNKPNRGYYKRGR